LLLEPARPPGWPPSGADAENGRGRARRAAAAPRDPRDPSGFVPHLDFHTTILMATGNLMFTMMGQPVSDVLRTKLERGGVDRAEWDRVDEHHLKIAEHIAARARRTPPEQSMREHLTALPPACTSAPAGGNTEHGAD